MKVLIDTNIVLDILLERKDYIEDSLSCIKKAIDNGDRLFISASSATDIYYIIRKQTGSRSIALDGLKKIAEIATFAEVNDECIYTAFYSKLVDFEDAVVDAVATNVNADVILTRNTLDFTNSTNTIMTPFDFMKC
ncbi:MAG: PIN domain-containing protein [Bacilli bacterium]|nr:PIN domain-containing protein [Bacilli bacterium]